MQTSIFQCWIAISVYVKVSLSSVKRRIMVALAVLGTCRNMLLCTVLRVGGIDLPRGVFETFLYSFESPKTVKAICFGRNRRISNTMKRF